MSTSSVYCLQGRHAVEPEEMSRIPTDNGKGWRRMCSECKNKLIEIRAEKQKEKVNAQKPV